MAAFGIIELIKEARRRRVFRVAGLYILGSWVLVQVADLAFPAIGVPEASIRYVWFGIILGFPVALVFGWRYQINDGRIMRTISGRDGIELALQRTDFVILAALAAIVVAIALGAIGDILRTQSPISQVDSSDAIDPASIAVLPFVNMSSNPENTFFADGISEELLNGLAKIPELRVIGRTSSFSLRNKAMDIREISQKLNVALVLEGSVRVAGERLRITAQLIDARDDSHLWSQTYQRSLDDVFAIQDEISVNVVGAITNELGLGQDQVLSHTSPENSAAYVEFLRARDTLRNADYDLAKIDEAIRLLESSVELDPSFSPGFAELARAYLSRADHMEHSYQPEGQREAIRLAQEAADVAVQLAPASLGSRVAWASAQTDADAKMEAFRSILETYPNAIEAYRYLGWQAWETGRIESALDYAFRYHSLDPLVADSSELLGHALNSAGRLRESSDYFRLSSELRWEVGADLGEPEAGWTEWAKSLPARDANLGQDMHLNMHVQEQCQNSFELGKTPESGGSRTVAYFRPLPDATGWCNTYINLRPDPYKGKYIRLVGVIKASADVNDAALWMRIDGDRAFFNLGFDNGMPDRITGQDKEWRPYELGLYVPDDAHAVRFGVSLSTGTVWVRSFRMDLSDSSTFN